MGKVLGEREQFLGDIRRARLYFFRVSGISILLRIVSKLIIEHCVNIIYE